MGRQKKGSHYNRGLNGTCDPACDTAACSSHPLSRCFHQQCEAASKTEFLTEGEESLLVERSDFQSGDVMLAGYWYAKTGEAVKGVVVIAPDFCGSHHRFMAWIDYFASNGYDVFDGSPEPDQVLMERILEWFDACCTK